MKEEHRTWEVNAQEFAALTKQGKDARLALLVACSVEKGSRGGDRKSKGNHPLKVDATAFAGTAGTDHKRVLRHLDAWNAVANERAGWHRLLSENLGPDDADAVNVPQGFIDRFNEKDLTGRTDAQRAGDVRRGLADPEVLSKPSTLEAIRTAVRKDPEARQAALEGYVESRKAEAETRSARPRREPTPKTWGDRAIELGIPFVAAVEMAIRDRELSEQNARELDELVGNLLDLLKQIPV